MEIGVERGKGVGRGAGREFGLVVGLVSEWPPSPDPLWLDGGQCSGWGGTYRPR